MPGETYEHGERIKCYVVGVSRGQRGPQITLSRTHPNLVRKLFALEVPEIADGSVEIVAVAREAGHRSKIAVRSNVPGLNAKGACIGPMGQRVRNVMSELAGEKIDIIDYDDDPARFVGNALSPSKVVSVTVVDADARAARVVVPDFQLSLAIGKEGQNARLAARLTGWRIDIRSDAAPTRTRSERHGRSTRRDPVLGDCRTDAEFGRESAVEWSMVQHEPPISARAPYRFSGANVCRMPEARAGRRSAAGGGTRERAATATFIVPDPRRRLPGPGCMAAPRRGLSEHCRTAPSIRQSTTSVRTSGYSAVEQYLENRHEHS